VEIAILLVGLALVVALWRIGTALQLLRLRPNASESLAAVLKQVRAELNQLRKGVAIATKSNRATAKSLFAIAASAEKATRHFLPDQRQAKPEAEMVEHEKRWRLENEKRNELTTLTRNLDAEGLARYIAHRYALPNDHPWVVSMVKLKEGIGLEALITALCRRDGEGQK
jgi:hypothetical protein